MQYLAVSGRLSSQIFFYRAIVAKTSEQKFYLPVTAQKKMMIFLNENEKFSNLLRENCKNRIYARDLRSAIATI
jgi:hypothetical protein